MAAGTRAVPLYSRPPVLYMYGTPSVTLENCSPQLPLDVLIGFEGSVTRGDGIGFEGSVTVRAGISTALPLNFLLLISAVSLI